MSTPDSVAFLRGINVGGHRVESGRLIAVFEQLGYDAVSTFLASGNVLFAADGDDLPGDSAGIERIETALHEALGYQVPTTVRSAAELARIAGHQPFPAEAIDAATGKPQVMLLFRPVPKARRRDVLGLAGPQDLLSFEERELHWLPSDGVADPDLDVNRILDLVDGYTMRTINTIARLSAKL